MIILLSLNEYILSFPAEFMAEDDRWDLGGSAGSSKALKRIERSA